MEKSETCGCATGYGQTMGTILDQTRNVGNLEPSSAVLLAKAILMANDVTDVRASL